MSHRLAVFLSYLFHPLLMVTYAVLFYYTAFAHVQMVTRPGRMLFVTGMFFLLTFVIPGLSAFMMHRAGAIRNMEMTERNDRLMPQLFTAAMYLVVFFMLGDKGIPPFISLFILGSVVAQLVATAVTLWWKISLHLVGLGGLCGGILGALLTENHGASWPIALAFFVSGLVGSARIQLEAHNFKQLYIGYLTGFVILFAAIFFFNA